MRGWGDEGMRTVAIPSERGEWRELHFSTASFELRAMS
jgi:hypothetical protein